MIPRWWRPILVQNRNNILAVEDLAVSYGHVQALKKIDLEINEGELVVLLGSNGSGKSTLLSAILGEIRPTKGVISFLGRDITGRPTEKIVAAGISIVPEGRGIIPLMTVLENLQLGAYHVKHDIGQDLERMFALFPI